MSLVPANPFPTDFRWGAAASAYQIEGAWQDDGKGLSLWDVIGNRPGKNGGETGQIACDHYHRFAEDVGHMRTIGLRSYRFSVSWPRVLPNGTGTINPKGLDFYNRLVDSLLEAGIEPWLTLFHWDYPMELYHRGGWLNRDSADWFADYAGVMAEALGDRVSHWLTLNEPQCFIGLGLVEGTHAPYETLPMSLALRAMHHALLGHGKAVQALRAMSPRPVEVGWAPTYAAVIPDSETPADIEAARREYFSVRPNTLFRMAIWTDAAYLGHFPEEAPEVYGADWPAITDADLKTIAQPLDFHGTNCYSGYRVRAGEDGEAVSVPFPTGRPTGSLEWLNLVPETVYWKARFQAERYGNKPFYVTENGFCNLDWVALDGRVHDPQRVDYVQRYLLGVKRALEEGIDIRGYFYWSIMDNFEWSEGYKSRFGLIHVDFETQKRTMKESAWWYRELIRTNGAILGLTDEKTMPLQMPETAAA